MGGRADLQIGTHLWLPSAVALAHQRLCRGDEVGKLGQVKGSRAIWGCGVGSNRWAR